MGKNFLIDKSEVTPKYAAKMKTLRIWIWKDMK